MVAFFTLGHSVALTGFRLLILGCFGGLVLLGGFGVGGFGFRSWQGSAARAGWLEYWQPSAIEGAIWRDLIDKSY